LTRCGYGPDANMIMTEDSFFEDNYSKAKAAGLRVGIYLYSYATTSEEVDIQTSWLINLLSDKQLDLPIAYDWESWHNFHDCNLNFYDLNDLTDKFLSTMQNNGYQVMNYGSKYYLEDIWNLPKYSVWLAQYNYEPTYSRDYLMWQISETGIVDGINNLVDIDILEK
jgi:lysozyme